MSVNIIILNEMNEEPLPLLTEPSRNHLFKGKLFRDKHDDRFIPSRESYNFIEETYFDKNKENVEK